MSERGEYPPYNDREKAIIGLLGQTEAAIVRANEVLRSAAEIAKRDGRETNWPAFTARLNDVLYEQHRLMVPDHDKTCGVPACLAWKFTAKGQPE